MALVVYGALCNSTDLILVVIVAYSDSADGRISRGVLIRIEIYVQLDIIVVSDPLLC
jgi:hypothetical protein